MTPDAIVFACANPVPEIWPWDAKAAGARIVATGRSDCANQVNNSLGFPGIFRGVLDVRARTITDEMAIAAAEALAGLSPRAPAGVQAHRPAGSRSVGSPTWRPTASVSNRRLRNGPGSTRFAGSPSRASIATGGVWPSRRGGVARACRSRRRAPRSDAALLEHRLRLGRGALQPRAAVGIPRGSLVPRSVVVRRRHRCRPASPRAGYARLLPSRHSARAATSVDLSRLGVRESCLLPGSCLSRECAFPAPGHPLGLAPRAIRSRAVSQSGLHLFQNRPAAPCARGDCGAPAAWGCFRRWQERGAARY